MNLESAKRFILQHNSFVLAAHRSPDGDTLGSCLALRLALISLGKEVTVVCPDTVPPYLQFLPGSETVSNRLPKQMEAVLYLDCGDHGRTAELKDSLEKAPFQFCIDHHETNPKNTKNGDWVENVAATAEMIYRLITALKAEMTKDIAVCLYTGIATDTGNFAYSNTTGDSFRITASLLEYGLELPSLNRILFRDRSLAKTKLIERTLSKMVLLEKDLIAISCLTMQDYADTGAIESDCEGLIDYLRDIDTVEVACLIRESADGSIRGSLRSKTGLDVSRIANRRGGGGHDRAAGFTLSTTLEKARELLMGDLMESVRQWKES